jgi:hypothetical protein
MRLHVQAHKIMCRAVSKPGSSGRAKSREFDAMGGTRGLIVLLAFAFGGAAVCFYRGALNRVRPYFPAEARRNYLLSMGFVAAFCLCVAILAYLERVFIFAVYALCVSLCTAGYVVVRWAKYQERP